MLVTLFSCELQFLNLNVFDRVDGFALVMVELVGYVQLTGLFEWFDLLSLWLTDLVDWLIGLFESVNLAD